MSWKDSHRKCSLKLLALLGKVCLETLRFLCFFFAVRSFEKALYDRATCADATYVLMLQRLSGSHGSTYGITLVITFIASLVVYFDGYLRHFFFTPGTNLQIDLSSYESQAFALSISFAINQSVYFTIFRKVGEEVYTADDDAVTERQSHLYQDMLLLGWAVGITLIVAWLQRADARKNILDEEDMYNASGSEQLDDTAYTKMDDASVRESVIDEFTCGGLISSKPGEGPCASAIHNTLFAWDSSDMTWNAFRRLINTSLGYAVGCAWFVWSIKMFADNLSNIAFIGVCLLYAVTMTIIGSFVMARFQLKLELETESLTARRSRQLMISAYRYIDLVSRACVVDWSNSIGMFNSNCLIAWVQIDSWLGLGRVYFCRAWYD